MLSQRIFRSYSLQSFSTTDMARMDVSSEQPPKRSSSIVTLRTVEIRANAVRLAFFLPVSISQIYSVERSTASASWAWVRPAVFLFSRTRSHTFM